MTWQFADARRRLAEVVDRALAEGPQRVRRRGDTVVIIAERDYNKVTSKRPDFKTLLMGEGPEFRRA